MPILNDAIADEATLHETPIMPDLTEAPAEDPQQTFYGVPHFDFGFLKAKTGDGAIEDYLQHPLNFDNSRGVAQILRGCTGIAGSLDLAILDIALGTIQVLKDKKEAAKITAANIPQHL